MYSLDTSKRTWTDHSVKFLRSQPQFPVSRRFGSNDDNGLFDPDPGGPVFDGRRTRGNELVVWIDDEKRPNLFAETPDVP